MHKLYITSIVASLLCGCTTRFADMTFATSKNINIEKNLCLKGSYRSTGYTKRNYIVGIPIGELNAKEALDRAIEQVDGAVALSDVVLDYKWWSLLVFAEERFVVRGTPVFYAEEKEK